MPLIDGLIDKQDTIEIVRDKIAQILADEVASQMALAAAASKDPQDWALKIYTERSNPIEAWLAVSTPDVLSSVDPTPIINVAVDTESFDTGASNVVSFQKAAGFFNIDCYGLGVAGDDGNGGHIAGDEAAAREAMRAVRLVRNILMAANYVLLELQGIVTYRMTQSITNFVPTQGVNTVQDVQAVRLVLEVHYCETSEQIDGEPLDCIHVDFKRAVDGAVLAQAEYLDGCEDPPPPAACTANFFDPTYWSPSKIQWLGTYWLIEGAAFDFNGNLMAIPSWAVGFRPTSVILTVVSAATSPTINLAITLYNTGLTVLGTDTVVFTTGNETIDITIPLDFSANMDIFLIDFIFDEYANPTELLCIEFV